MRIPLACLNPFMHLHNQVATYDHPCGHQYDVLPCGCAGLDDHDHEPCDGLPVAELEEAR
ncbi:hypothetical protein ACWKSP_22215 [Micromonosporaceae bacterium Da 78-11]